MIGIVVCASLYFYIELKKIKSDIEQIKSPGRAEKDAVIITELPFQTNKAALIERIADLVNDKKLKEGKEHKKIHRPWGFYVSIEE